VAEEEYDATDKLWKISIPGLHPRQVPGTDGETLLGRFFAATWDIQNEHVSLGYNNDSNGHYTMFNSEVPKMYDNVTRYSTPTGLMQIMQ
jgi:hypothetical protein